jgi:SAM-dependent methyltransferase
MAWQARGPHGRAARKGDERVSSVATAAVPELVLKHLEMFMCPACGEGLSVADAQGGLECRGCARLFSCEDGIPRLFWPTEWRSGRDVTDIVKAFYEATPFPNYDDMDSAESLRSKAEKGVFARLLNDQIPHGAKILECGCGTGQLSNFLGLTWGRTVFASDVCLNSLRLGHQFKERNEIQNVGFVQMNLFRPTFRPESFDFVISNGVLHHTGDAFQGFKSILSCLRKGGFIIIGLYNTYGRLTTDLRRLVFRVTGDRFRFLDPRLRSEKLVAARERAWFMDQYKHPHESKHTMDEVLRWFDSCGVEFVNSIPKVTAAGKFSARETLFTPSPSGSKADRLMVQLGMLLTGGREGGFFIMIGRKKG